MNSSLATQISDLGSFANCTPDKRSPKKPYNPYIPMNFSRKNLVVKTVEGQQEFFDALKLRYRVFYEEKVGAVAGGIDRDLYDEVSDLLIIKDLEHHRVVGTYRLISDTHSSKFYSESEFRVDDFLGSPGRKLELGRACIDNQYRNGAVIHLLWRGISEYAVHSDSQYLFGCSSIFTQDESVVANIYRYLASMNMWSDEYGIRPHEKYQMKDEIDLKSFGALTGDEIAETKAQIPTLMKSYLKAGAKIYGQPAYDPEFKCYDLFTVLDLSKLTDSYRKKYR